MAPHAEPPTFVKWIIWLFEKETWKKQPLIASIAAIIALATMVSAVVVFFQTFADNPHETSSNDRLVVVMDSYLLRYNRNRTGETNADDIIELVGGMVGGQTDKELVSPNWHRYDWIIDKNPDLLIVHWSAFGPEVNFRSLLRAMESTQSKILIYTRHRFDDGEMEREISNYESLFPKLEGRIVFLPLHPDPILSAPNNSLIVREVREMLTSDT